MIACWRGHLSTVMELIRAGAKTDTQDQVCVCVCMCLCVCVCGVQEGLTSLMLATQNGHADIVEALLDTNCDPNITENVSIEREMVATLFIDFCFSTDCWLECTAFCRQVSKSTHH